jgi:hypothetical protein
MEVNEVAWNVNGGELTFAVRQNLRPGYKTAQDQAAFGGLRVFDDQFLAAFETPVAGGQLRYEPVLF